MQLVNLMLAPQLVLLHTEFDLGLLNLVVLIFDVLKAARLSLVELVLSVLNQPVVLDEFLLRKGNLAEETLLFLF